MRTVYLDLETTGLNPVEDEIVEIGILADNGEAIVDSLVRPQRHKSWPRAQRIHGISPADVREAPVLEELRSRIERRRSSSRRSAHVSALARRARSASLDRAPRDR